LEYLPQKKNLLGIFLEGAFYLSIILIREC